MVTEGATWGHAANADINFDMAAAWALGRSLISEQPVMISGMTDIEPGTPLEVALLQVGADLALAQAESAWRGRERYAHRLQPRPYAQFLERSLPVAKAEGYALTVSERSGFEGLRWRRRAPPQPGEGQLTLAVEAVGINFRDVLKVLDLYPLERAEWRWLGDECTGRVVAVGEGVTGFAPGDLVVAIAPDCMGSHAVTDARLVSRCPPSLPPEQAAGIPIAFLTAWYSLVEIGRLKRGETVLIHAAAGGVGQAAVQIARHLGARVLATASPSKQALVTALGADAVFNSRDLSFADAVRSATNGEGVDVVLNSLAGEALVHSVDLLKSFGRLSNLASAIFSPTARLICARCAITAASSPSISPRGCGDIRRSRAAAWRHPAPHRARRTAPGRDRCVTDQFGGRDVSWHGPGPARRQARPARRCADRAAARGRSGPDDCSSRRELSHHRRHVEPRPRRRALSRGSRRAASRVVQPQRACGGCRRARDRGDTKSRAAVHLRACDIGDPDAAKALFAGMRRDLPPLRGIVHGAMVLDDVDVMGLDAKRLDRVLRPKAVGAWNLSVLSEKDDLDWFVLHGSISATLGAAGQSNYVVANHLLEALVAHRRQRGLPAQSVAWGPIASGGVVARSDQLRKYFELLGFTSLTGESIEDALGQLLRSDEASVTVCGVDWMRLASALSGFESDSRFRHLLDAAKESDGGDLAQTLVALEPARRRDLLAGLIVAQTAAVLGIPADQVPHDRRLGELGLDSLMAFELAATLESKLGRRLPIATLQGNRSVAELAERIERVFAGGGGNVSGFDGGAFGRERTCVADQWP